MAAKKALTVAAELQKVRAEIAAFDATIRPLKEMEDQLREEMLAALRRERLATLKTDDGVSYVRAYRASLSVTDPAKALEWAVEHNAAKVDTTRAAKLLKGAGALPEGFQQEETEYLTIKNPKDE